MLFSSSSSTPPARQRVLVFGSYGPSLEVFRGALISTLVDRGCEVHVIAAAITPELEAKLRRRGAIVHKIELRRGSLDALRLLMEILATRRQIRAIDPDVIIAYTIKPIVMAAAAGGRARLLALVTGLGFAFTEGSGTSRRVARIGAAVLYNIALRRAQTVVFQNADDLETFRSEGILPAKSQVALIAGSGVELDRFCPAPLPAGPRFLMAARLLGDKGIREFAIASARLLQVRPAVSVTLAGFFDASADSIERDELDRMIAAGIEYLGHLDDIRPAIVACGIYVLPSYREGTPRSVLEAMAMGRAIITSDAPGCRETVVHGENGLLVPPRDADALFAAMLALADDEVLVARMGDASRRLAERKFDVHAVNAEILRLAKVDG